MTGRGFTPPLMWNKKEKKEEEGTEGREWGCAGARTKRKKEGGRQTKGKGKRENRKRERERDKEGLNGDRK